VEQFAFRVLGPLEVSAGGAPLPLGGPRQRALLAVLLLNGGRVVSRDRIVDAIWGENPPATATNAVQVAVHELRKLLGTDRVLTQGTGYRVVVEPGELDLDRFERLLERARDEPSARAASTLREALALPSGALLADLSHAPFVAAERERVAELILVALERRIDADLDLGAHRELVAELEALVVEHPYREGLWERLMLALYRSGRQADALDAYRRARTALREDLGVEPSKALRELEAAILRHDSALDAAAAVDRTELPTPARPLVGRTLELAAVTALVRTPDTRVVTLTGPGGTGKTRLALEAAHELRSDFDGGVFFADLGSLPDAELVGPTVARALGVRDTSAEAVVERVAARVARHAMLLVVDNFEHVLTAATLVADLVAAIPSLRVLATSREPLRVRAEHEYRVPPLGLPGPAGAADLEAARRAEAVQLFVARARAARPDFELTAENAAPVVAICRALDGLPLALELAAPRVKLLSPAMLLDRLSDRLGALAEGERDLPPRLRTLRGAIDWSYDLLAPEEQALLAGLSVFSGGWSLDAAEAVCGADLAGLGSLVEKSLVQTGGSPDAPRFSMLETVREYALERLARAGDTQEMRDRHAEYFAGVAEALEPELHGPEALDEAEREHDNIRAAWTHAQSTGQVELLLRLCAIARLWYVRGYQSEGLARVEDALGEQGGTPRRRALILGWAATLAWTQGDYELSIARAHESLALNREVGDERTEFRALGMLGLAHFSSGDAVRGREFHTRSLELARAMRWERETALALSNLAEIASVVGEHAEARELWSESLELSRRLSNAEAPTASASLQAAVAALEGHDEDEALPLILESLRIVRDLDFKDFIASALVAYARAVLEKDGVLAARALGAAGAIRAQLGPAAFRFEPDWYARSLERVHELLGDEAAPALEAGASAPDRVVAEILA
jgi:predicted ATPase/DNA-binding SARP family transcriptional activator